MMATAEELSEYAKGHLAVLLTHLDQKAPGHCAAVVIWPKGHSETPGSRGVSWVEDDASAALRGAADIVDFKEGKQVATFQQRAAAWVLECFGPEGTKNILHRCYRFLEEALELVQSLGMSRVEAHQLVDYVFGREKGDPWQEAGGTSMTLAALCTAADIDMAKASEMELARVWTKVEAIRAKEATKPKTGPLPGKAP